MGGELMPGPTADECTAYLVARNDVSLGVVPQLLLDEAGAERWAFFWYAARHVDDDIEAGRLGAEEWALRLRSDRSGSPAERALGEFARRLPPGFDLDALKEELVEALVALGRERSFREPPALTDYVDVVRGKAGVPLRLLHRFLFLGEAEPAVTSYTNLLAFAVQVGDDLRDRPRDAAAGIHTLSREELALAGAEELGDADEAPQAIQSWRKAASKRWALLALEESERFRRPENRASARIETFLWLRAVDTGQLDASEGPLRWPHPLGTLGVDGAPSRERMQELRERLRDLPRIVAGPAKYENPFRTEELQRLRGLLPALYLDMERTIRA